MDKISKYLAKIGRKGGKSGKGDSKRRGNSDYYWRIRKGNNKQGAKNEKVFVSGDGSKSMSYGNPCCDAVSGRA